MKFEKDGSEKKFLIFFRLMVSIIALIEIASLAGDLSLLFSDNSTIVPQDLMYLQSGYFKYLYPFYQFLDSYNLTNYFYSYAIFLYILSLLFLLVGLFTRYSAFIALILQLIIFKSFSPFNYGYDFFLTMSLFYCLVFPVGNYYSLDKKIFKGKAKTNLRYRKVLQIHLSTVYFFSGIAKGLDSGWWNGDSLWRAMASVDNSFYHMPSFILVIIGVGTVLIEFSYPFLVYKKVTRKYILTSIIIMHLSIAVMLDLYAFSTIMIMWNIAAFGNLDSFSQKKYIDVKTV
jgi:uncharacterized membrane protein YphA (DoxX/SURF4 family)